MSFSRSTTRLGAIKPGLLADLIAVEGDSNRRIEAVPAISFVIKDGAVVVASGRV